MEYMADSDNRIHIALSPWDLTDDYNRHAGATLLSILDHCSQPVVAHLLYDEKLCVGKEKETGYNKACYQKIADGYGCELQYHHVELPEWVNNLETVKKWTPGTLMRLYLPELLPQIDKIIYFDCDMIINTDVVTLWNTQLGNTPLAACPDTAAPNYSHKRKKTYQNVGIVPLSCFCAGTLIFNLRAIRELDDSFSNILIAFLHDNPDIPYLDQDILNWFCQGNYTKLDGKYNNYVDESALAYAEDSVIHYASAYGKPWKWYHGKIDDYYWNYLIKTPWCDDRQNLTSYLREAPDVSKALTIAKKDMLCYIDADSKIKKGTYALKYIIAILGSCINGLLIWRRKIQY